MKWSLLVLLLLGNELIATGQNVEGDPTPGEVSGRIFTLFNYSLDPDNSSTAFEVRRAYFGYKRNLSEHFSAEVKLDIGSVDDQSEYNLIRRYTYFKNAYLSYQKGPVKAWFGLFDMLQFKVQEKFWGYRYLYKSYLDEYKFGSSADIGAGIQYIPVSRFSADLVISNGEGYQNLQFDNIYRIGAGVTFNPVQRLSLRGYYTIHTNKISQMIFTGFIGYRMKKLRFASEYNHQINYQFIKGHSRFGYSFYSTYTFSDTWEIFARYDQLFSNVLPEEGIPWNLANDGSAVVAGIQFTPMKYLHVSLNYQDWVEFAENGGSEPFLYLNLEIVF